jgi:hypothetical protein
MLLRTPEQPNAVAFSGALELRALDDHQRRQRAPDAQSEIESPPIVTIGTAEWWDIVAVYEAEARPLSGLISTKLDEFSFFLTRLAVSFRPSDQSVVDRARLSVELAGVNPSETPPIAKELHPLEVLEEKVTNVNVEISPSLKFVGVEASLGSVALAVSYDEIIPAVTADGGQEATFGWELRSTKHHQLRGVKYFHAILQVPRAAAAAVATLRVSADVVSPNGFLYRASVRKEDRPLLVQRIGP